MTSEALLITIVIRVVIFFPGNLTLKGNFLKLSLIVNITRLGTTMDFNESMHEYMLDIGLGYITIVTK